MRAFMLACSLAFVFGQSMAIACDKNVREVSDCDELDRFFSMSEKIDKALFVNDLEAAIALAEEYLALSEKHSKSWNHGNAIHDGNAALSIVELRKGNNQKAAEFLIAAGQSPGSPQLNSFGPDFTLANVLLERGEEQAVIHYLRGVAEFWGDGKQRIPDWIKAIKNGKQPTLSRRP